jgi:hypothetical protein
MVRLRQRNIAWLSALGLLIGFGLLAGGTSVSLPVQLALLGIFGVAMVASLVEFGRSRTTLLETLRRAPIRQRISPQAKEAQERARARGGYVSDALMMIDVGLIAVQSSHEGMAMRRTRSISKDDDGAQPFVTFFVDSVEADRNAIVRFEMIDHYGQVRFVHEVRSYLREGEMNVMSDHRLPLADNADITGAGDWELRVLVDGRLMGLHHFTLSPSLTERTRRLARTQGTLIHDPRDEDEETFFDIIDEAPQPKTPRIQDLLGGDDSKLSPSEDAIRRRSSMTTRRRGEK